VCKFIKNNPSVIELFAKNPMSYFFFACILKTEHLSRDYDPSKIVGPTARPPLKDPLFYSSLANLNNIPVPRQYKHGLADILLSYYTDIKFPVSSEIIEICSLIRFEYLCKFFPLKNREDQLKFLYIISSIIKTNSFSVCSNDVVLKYPVLGIYPRAALMNHSCAPNCIQIFLPKTWEFEVRACRDIQKGEELFISYLPLNLPFWVRQVFFFYFFNF
jgi:hypothetical protein